ncbi:endonuclease domain-containing protein [Sphingomonas sp. HF-S3]|uniref:Endonuclease domain-containing protein n=1 Tax=Sphingomonas rustica TaxID=3103142 RepID=A0ABV0BEA6_9SPHN
MRRAKQLRRAMSLPEVLLWRELRKRPGGLKFRHQHPAGPYILDFYCAEVDLAIEVDGEVHGRGDRPERDGVRDAWLHERDVRVLRILASDVLRDLDAVILHIVTTARA